MNRNWILGLVVIHLGVVAAGLWSHHSWPPTLALFRNTYQSLTGAGGGFGFFSPDVGNQILIHFETQKGEVLRLHELVSPEVALRIGNMYRLFAQTYENETLKRSVAASLTVPVFRHYPQEKSLTLVASVYRFPSLTEYREGQRPEEKEVYRATFRVDASPL